MFHTIPVTVVSCDPMPPNRGPKVVVNHKTAVSGVHYAFGFLIACLRWPMKSMSVSVGRLSRSSRSPRECVFESYILSITTVSVSNGSHISL